MSQINSIKGDVLDKLNKMERMLQYATQWNGTCPKWNSKKKGIPQMKLCKKKVCPKLNSKKIGYALHET